LAKEVVTKAIQKGKAVVTANKALIAQFLDEIQELCLQNIKLISNMRLLYVALFPLLMYYKTHIRGM